VGSTIAAFAIAVIVLIIGCFLGWHANRTYAAHSDVKTTRGRIAGYRKTRLRSGVIALAFIVVALLVVAAAVRH
jgi:DNA-binding transcriptional regulator of glucitol operon